MKKQLLAISMLIVGFGLHNLYGMLDEDLYIQEQQGEQITSPLSDENISLSPAEEADMETMLSTIEQGAGESILAEEDLEMIEPVEETQSFQPVLRKHYPSRAPYKKKYETEQHNGCGCG